MPNKRALVIYDTKYGSTEQIANWIAEGINDAEIQHVDDVSSLFYDLIIIGSPIYAGYPSNGIIKFLDKNTETLKNRKLAIFTVSVPQDMTPDRAKRYMGSKDYSKLYGHIAGNVIATKAFLGKIDLKEMTELDRLSLRLQYFLKGHKLKDVNFMSRDEAISWGKRLFELLTAVKETEAKAESTKVD